MFRRGTRHESLLSASDAGIYHSFTSVRPRSSCNVITDVECSLWLVRADAPGKKLADLPVQQSTKVVLYITSRPRKRSVSRCSRHCSPASIEIDLS
jgi:hypothetical protein